jgi:hypothetical protein
MYFTKSIYENGDKNACYQALREDLIINSVMRPVCTACNKNPCAPNYYRDGVRHWRTRCSVCVRKGRKQKPQKPRWELDGYKKKMVCDLCRFKAKYASQITVWHINGNLNDSAMTNLRSVCLCCVEEVKRKMFTWRIGDLEAD